MKRIGPAICGVVVLALLISFSSSFADGVQIQSDTVIKALQRNSNKGSEEDTDELLLPVYEYLGLDYGDTEGGGLSFHFYGWGRKDLAGTDYFEDDPDGDLLYGYLEYSKPYGSFKARLGRQHLFAGVTNESVDGLRLGGSLSDHFSLTLFGGMPSAYDDAALNRGEVTYGGRLSHQNTANYEVGLSYQRIDGSDGLLAEKAGADLNVHWGSWFSFNGLSSYNVNSGQWREHNYSMSLQWRDFLLEPLYQYFQYSDYFGSNHQRDLLFDFLKDSDEILTIAGADLLYQGSTPFSVGVRTRHYQYDLRREGALYLAGLLTWNTNQGSQIGMEAGRMDGETAETVYALCRGYFYWANPLNMEPSTFISGDALLIAYDTPVFGRDRSTHFTLSAGRSFWDDTLEIKLSGLYSQDPYFDEDVGAVLTFQLRY